MEETAKNVQESTKPAAAPQPKESEEQDKAMEEQKKMMEEMRSKQMEEQKKMMEEQMKTKKAQLDMTIKQLDVNRIMVKKTIERIKADADVIEKVDMVSETNEYKKAALKAKLAEIIAILEGEALKLEMIDMNKEMVTAQIEQLKNPPAMPQGMGGMMPGMGGM
jgi:hypothetical protein